MSSRNTFAATRRSHTILNWLRHGQPVKIQDVVDEFDIQYPQAREDLKLLEEVYGLSTHRDGRIKVWSWSDEETEYVEVGTVAALELGAISLDIFKETPYGEAIRELADECRDRIHDSHHPRLTRLSEALHLRRTWLPTSPDDILEHLELALNTIWKGGINWLVAHYRRSDGEVDDYLLLPRRLIWYQRRLWLLALDRDELKLFDLAGIQELETYSASEHVSLHSEPAAADGGETVEQLAHPVEYDDEKMAAFLENLDDDPDSYFADAFGIYAGNYPVESIHLEVSGRWQNYLDRYRIHSSQQNEPDDERDTLHVRLEMGICPEFKSFVMGMIPEVRVHEPERLGEELRERATKWLAPDSEADQA